jgi:hypothetical protein
LASKEDLESDIRASYQVIRDYRRTIQTSDRPEEKLRARRETERQWKLIEGYLKEYDPLVGGMFPRDIAEIATHFPAYRAQVERPAPSATPRIAQEGDAAPRFLDVEIHIQRRHDTGYPVRITLDGQEHSTPGYLAAGLLPWVATDDEAADGIRLFKALLADEGVQVAWYKATGRSARRRIRLWIDEDAPELHTLPWELLYADGGLLSAHADTPFSRYLPVDRPWGDAIEKRPVRVLAALSNPTDLERFGLAKLDAVQERSVLKRAFAGMPGGAAELVFLEPPVTLERLEQTLREGYHVLHYVGHGRYIPEKEATALYFEQETGTTQPVTDDALTGMLRRLRVRPQLVYLASCQSAKRSSSDAYVGLGPKLVRAGVPAVVAMQELVTVDTARKLTSAFYQSLLQGGIVDLAMNEARSTLLTAGRWDAAVPVLFMRLKDGRLW